MQNVQRCEAGVTLRGQTTHAITFCAPELRHRNSDTGTNAGGAKVKAEAGKARPNVIRWKPLRADVAASGDLGYTWGVAESGPGKEGPFKPYGIYVTIWKRQADGKWKFVYDAATIVAADAVEKFLREKFPAMAAPPK